MRPTMVVPPEVAKDTLEILLKYLSDRVALAVAFASIVCLLLILLPYQIGVWMLAHWQWPFFGLLFAVCYLPTRAILDGVSERSAKNRQVARLHNLTKREKEILSPFVHNDYRSRRIIHSDPVAIGLVDDGILYCPSVPLDANNYRAYNIQNWALLYLANHLELINPRDANPRTGDY